MNLWRCSNKEGQRCMSEGMYPKRELKSTERTLVGFSQSKVACSVERGKMFLPTRSSLGLYDF